MKKHILRQLLPYLRPYKVPLFCAFLAAVLSVVFGLFSPVLIGRAVDFIMTAEGIDFPALYRTILLLLFCAAAASALTWVMCVLTRKVSARAAMDLRTRAFLQINKAPLSRLDRERQGDIISRLVNDADAVSEGLLQAILQLLPGVVTAAATVVLMCMLNLWIALAVIFVTPLSIFFARFVGMRTSKYFIEQTKAQGELSAFVNEMAGNLPLVQALGYEEHSAAEFEERSKKYYTANFKATLYSSIVNPGARFVNAIVYGCVCVFGALYTIGGGALSVGSLSAFLAYANQYTRPFNEITAVLTQMQAAIASAGRLLSIIRWEEEPQDAQDAAAPTSSDGHVEAAHVQFSYTDKPFIEDFTLDVQPGMRIALVGPTGCGKTTLINLLMRFYDTKGGTISVDGTPIKDIRRDSLRSLYGMVLQESWLTSGTIRENIAYARPDAPIEEVVKAAKEALIHNFIMQLPKGYDTPLDNSLTNFSAGQRQLLCIARIMLAKPDILLLDEATSSIDTRTELRIQRALERLIQGRTSFIVAHRLSTIRTADLILVMQAGRIIERGTHDDLLQRNGFYAQLFYSQFADS